jgi:hypothetical protein
LVGRDDNWYGTYTNGRNAKSDAPLNVAFAITTGGTPGVSDMGMAGSTGTRGGIGTPEMFIGTPELFTGTPELFTGTGDSVWDSSDDITND